MLKKQLLLFKKNLNSPTPNAFYLKLSKASMMWLFPNFVSTACCVPNLCLDAILPIPLIG